MKRIFFSIMLFIYVFTLSSCVSKPYFFNKSTVDKKNIKIALLPFIDYHTVEGNNNNSGDLVRSAFESGLTLKGFNVIEIENTSLNVDYTVLKKHEFPAKWIIETGKLAGTDYMILGSVHDYRTYENITSFLYIFSWFESTSTVGVTARMISCKTGEVVWSGTYTKSSYSFNDAAREAVNSLIRTIKVKSNNPGCELTL